MITHNVPFPYNSHISIYMHYDPFILPTFPIYLMKHSPYKAYTCNYIHTYSHITFMTFSSLIHSCIPSQHTTHIPLSNHTNHMFLPLSLITQNNSSISTIIPYAYTSHPYITTICLYHIHSTCSSHINIYVHHVTHIVHASMYFHITFNMCMFILIILCAWA